MADRAPFLKTPYGGYLHRDIPGANNELTRVAPGTPCGEYLRRFWQPVILAAEIKDLPRKIKVLDEDLVVFRDLSGRIGLLELHCSHRGTSLEFGRIADRGIRCCYHGWLFDVDGKILETPGEPPGSTIKERLFHGAYPTREYRGIVFAYMGPPDQQPAFPIYDTCEVEGYRHVPIYNLVPCNWLQIKENSMDPVHTVFLHTHVSGTQFTDAFGDLGVVEWAESPIGMVYIHTRRAGDKVWVRMNDFILPNIHQFPPTGEDATTEKVFQGPAMTAWAVPIDDTHTISILLRHTKDDKAQPGRTRAFGQTGDRPYEDRQRQPGDYDAQTGQRPIAVHALEHLGATDRGVIQLRKMLREGIRAVQEGEAPCGLARAGGQPIRTYSNDTILAIPPAPTPESDKELLRRTGREIASKCLGVSAPKIWSMNEDR
jgi:phenylpropionate dioxygenase-like ring-hydroxylating dioxygenase large terminal subunit